MGIVWKGIIVSFEDDVVRTMNDKLGDGIE